MAEFSVDDLSDVVDELSNGNFDVTRRGATTYVDGVRVAAAPSTITFRGLIYPIAGRELERLPEGLQGKEVIGIITKTKLLEASTTNEPDVVSYDDNTYQIEQGDRWKASGNFFAYVASKVNLL